MTRALGFLFKIVLSRTVTTEMLGVYTVVVSIFMVFVTTINSGLPLAVSKSTTIYSNNPKKTFGSVSSALIFSLVLFVITFLLIVLGKPLLDVYFNNSTAYIILLSMIPAILFTAIYVPFKGYLWGKEKFLSVSIVEFVEQIIRIVCYIICIFVFININPIISAGISLSVACILSTILGIIIFYKSKGKLSSPKTCFKSIYNSSAPVTLIRVATGLMQPLIAFILPLQLVSAGYTSEQALSQLGIIMGMTLPLLTIPLTIIGSLSMAIIPNLTSMYNQKQFERLKKQTNASNIFTLCCCFTIVPIFMALGVPIAELLFNNTTAGIYLQYGCWLIIPMGLSQITTTTLNSLNKEKHTFIYYILGSILMLLAIVFLPSKIGIYALIYGMGGCMTLISILNIIKINKTLNGKTNYVGTLLKLVLITVPCMLLTKWLYSILLFSFSNIISLIVCGAICFVCYALLVAVFNIVDITYINLTKKQA